MIVLPLQVSIFVIRPVSMLVELGKCHVFFLPDSVKAAIIVISVQLHPIVALVPSHSRLLELMDEVYNCKGMLSESNDTQPLVYNSHRYRRPPRHNSLHQLMVMH